MAHFRVRYATALRLLRLGAEVVVTTRFPKDCLRRYAREPDAGEWVGRLWVCGVDFRAVPAVVALGETLAARFPRIDIIINNAAQTVRRPAAHYAGLVAAEETALPPSLQGRLLQATDAVALQRIASDDLPGLTPALPQASAESVGASTDAVPETGAETETETGAGAGIGRAPTGNGNSCAEVASVSASAGGGTEALQAPTEEPPDRRAATSWTAQLGEISWVEGLEVQLVNAMAPFTLLSALKPCLLAGPAPPPAGAPSPGRPPIPATPAEVLSGAPARVPPHKNSPEWRRGLARQMRFVVNVTSQEGSFRGPGAKGPAHPHTNMAKASLNMMTCSVADALARDGVAVVSVDTGWISRMKPEALAEAQPHLQVTPPLTAEDGAARVLDPILSALNGAPPVTGCLLRNFQPVDW